MTPTGQEDKKMEKTKTVDLLSILLFDTMATAEQPDQKRSKQ